MFSNNSKVSTRQIKRLLILDIFSTTSLILPRIAVDNADQDGVISIIIGTAIALLYASLIIMVTKKIRGNFIEYSKLVLGSFLTYIIAILYTIKIGYSCVYVVRMFSDVITTTILPTVSYKIVIASIILVCSYAASKGMEVRGRLAELLFFIVLIPITFVLALAIPKVNITYTMPLFVNSVKDIFSGGYSVFITYSAIELLLFASPYIKHSDKLLKPVISGVCLVGFFNIAIFLITVGLFGVEGTRAMQYPALAIMEIIRLPGGFLGRQDALMISFWIISIFAVISAGLFYLSIILKQTIKAKEQSYLVIPFGIIIYFVTTMCTADQLGYENFSRYMAYIGIPQSIIIPIIILLIAKIRGGKKVD